MKKNICCILFILIAVCIVYISMTYAVYTETIRNDRVIKYVDSEVIFEKLEETLDEEDIISSIEGQPEEIYDESYVVVEESIRVFEENLSTAITNEVLVGSMSGYGPDCVGCSGYLAYGLYVGDGTIYYNDSQYGQVRIVAGDRSIEFGTIIKINDSMLAIVLDRGGAIGFGKKCLFDLLYASEAEANENGVLRNANFEILRYGF